MKTIRRMLNWLGLLDYCEQTHDGHVWTQWSAVAQAHDKVFQCRRCNNCGIAETRHLL